MADTPHHASDLLELVPDIIYEYRVDPEPGFVYITPSVTAILGYTPEEHYADPSLGRRLVHPDDAAMLDEIVAAPDEDRVYLIRWLTRSGDAVTTAQRVRALRASDGRITGVIGVSRPVAQGGPGWTVRFGDLVLDLAAHRARIGGEVLALTPSEQQLLALLASADRTFTRQELVERLWGAYHVAGERAVEVHVSNLRRKLGVARDALRLVTVRGVGYRLVGVRPAAGLKMS